jgi:hypothetical protein
MAPRGSSFVVAADAGSQGGPGVEVIRDVSAALLTAGSAPTQNVRGSSNMANNLVDRPKPRKSKALKMPSIERNLESLTAFELGRPQEGDGANEYV